MVQDKELSYIVHVSEFWEPSDLSQHPSVVGLPVHGQVLVQDPQGVLFKDGCDVGGALHRRHRLREDAVHKDHPLFRGGPCKDRKR